MSLATPTQHKTTSAPLAFKMTDAEFVRIPYPRYRELRETPQLHRSRDGLWVLTRHADVLAALREPRLSSNPRHVEPSEHVVAQRTSSATSTSS